MPEIEREPCPRCGEAVNVAASLCPFCRAPLLVRLVLDAPVAYAADRRTLARTLAALGPPVGASAVLEAQLAGPRPLVAAGLTRRAAHRLAAVLTGQGRPWEIEPDLSRPGSSRLPLPLPVGRQERLALAAGTGALVLAVLGYLWLRPSSYSPTEVAKRALPATVLLSCSDTLGTGFFVTPRLVLTNAHVLCEGADRIQVTAQDNRKFQARTVKSDPDLDLAVLEADEEVKTPLPLGDATQLEPGQDLVMVGNPLGLAQTVHEVKVSRMGQPLMGTTYLQVEGNVNPGNSGGPLLDLHGRVVGIVTMKVEEGRGIGLALPVNYATARSAFVPGPPEKDWRGIREPSLGRFEALVDEARRDDDLEAAKMRTAFDRPSLADVFASAQRGTPVVLLALRSPWAPTLPRAGIVVQRGGQPLCDETAPVLWKKADAMSGATPPFVRWLARHGMADDLYFGFAPLRSGACSSYSGIVGAEVQLRDAEPGARRLVVEAIGH